MKKESIHHGDAEDAELIFAFSPRSLCLGGERFRAIGAHS